MFAATIGGYNERTQPVFMPQPTNKKQPSLPSSPEIISPSSGQRKAGEVTLGAKQKQDPTRKLMEEILGKT